MCLSFFITTDKGVDRIDGHLDRILFVGGWEGLVISFIALPGYIGMVILGILYGIISMIYIGIINHGMAFGDINGVFFNTTYILSILIAQASPIFIYYILGRIIDKRRTKLG
jgi:hypothetical protein